jgi:hypothetical protein
MTAKVHESLKAEAEKLESLPPEMWLAGNDQRSHGIRRDLRGAPKRRTQATMVAREKRGTPPEKELSPCNNSIKSDLPRLITFDNKGLSRVRNGRRGADTEGSELYFRFPCSRK